MFGLREAGVLSASIILGGGIAYVVWNRLSSRLKKFDTRSGEDGKSGEEEKNEEGPVTETVVAAVEAPNTSTSQPVDSEGTQILVLGLDGAGKSSLLHCFSIGSLEQDLEPTQGFNAVSVSRDNLHIEFLEIGGKEDLRQYWSRYMSRALLLVFVVDSSNPQLFPVVKKHLHELLPSHPQLPVMVLANKQDLPGCCSITDLYDALSLNEVGERQLFLIGTHVRKGEKSLSSGVQDARDMIVSLFCDSR